MQQPCRDTLIPMLAFCQQKVLYRDRVSLGVIGCHGAPQREPAERGRAPRAAGEAWGAPEPARLGYRPPLGGLLRVNTRNFGRRGAIGGVTESARPAGGFVEVRASMRPRTSRCGEVPAGRPQRTTGDARPATAESGQCNTCRTGGLQDSAIRRAKASRFRSARCRGTAQGTCAARARWRPSTRPSAACAGDGRRLRVLGR